MLPLLFLSLWRLAQQHRMYRNDLMTSLSNRWTSVTQRGLHALCCECTQIEWLGSRMNQTEMRAPASTSWQKVYGNLCDIGSSTFQMIWRWINQHLISFICYLILYVYSPLKLVTFYIILLSMVKLGTHKESVMRKHSRLPFVYLRGGVHLHILICAISGTARPPYRRTLSHSVRSNAP